jgi:MoaA/NifB/PqqE/SkfB family radical SAM enzyme
MKLEEIGFYTLSDKRAKDSSSTSPMMRCEMILTDKCNFKCQYCRGHKHGELDFQYAQKSVWFWIKDGLQNIRFSGGEPTLYPDLNNLVLQCHLQRVKRIAISTNGSRSFDIYEQLLQNGVNDFSISLDACCAADGDSISGNKGSWNKVVENIRKLSKLTYVTVGVVLNEDNVSQTVDIVKFAHDLGVADIRLISAAQYNKLLSGLENIPQEILNMHPILRYRVNNLLNGINVRGLKDTDCHKCHLIKDDSIIAGQYHFPCVIHMREGGSPVGHVNENMRKRRIEWFEKTDTHQDPICKENCLDVCRDYNNHAEEFKTKHRGQ